MTSDVSWQQARARRFAAMHDEMLVLPNAWDAASAALFTAVGAQAIATTSGGSAWSRGFADGNMMNRSQAIDAIAAITRVVDVPVSADIEAGYADSTDQLEQTIEGVLTAGVVGINIEDNQLRALRDIDAQCQRIAVARQRAQRFGVDLFINARIDTYLLGGQGSAGSSLRDVIDRARAYVDAGANGVFVPGLLDPCALQALVAATPAPLNVMAAVGAPSIIELAQIGVRRVSIGTGLAQLAYGSAQRAAGALLLGAYPALDGLVSYAELNKFMSHDALEETPR